MLKIRRLRAGYGPVNVLFDVDLEASAGMCVGVLGPNGAGKTTLLRAISGFLRPSAGEVELEGHPITRCPPHEIVRRGLSQVLQGRQVLGPMSVRDNLLLGGHLTFARAGRASVTEALEEVYGLFPILKERAALQAGSLSGGEQQMLAIGRALMSRPRVLLLDEPSMGLAPLIVEQILDVLRTIKATGMTMLLIEQNPDFAFGLADRCCVLDSGHVIVAGETDALRDNAQMASLYLGSAH
ncbi:MAG: transporter related [Enterovirga sp.]|nr:transporter related [Enterovirga sp.]